MARIELTLLKAEISKYLGIPYYQNPRGKGTGLENVLVGKGTAHEIALQTIEFANEQNLKLINLSEKEIYNFQKKHLLGIDCSGLAYNLLQFIKPDLDRFVIGTEGKRGVRRASADLLTSELNAVPVNELDQIQTADLIRVNSGRHVIFIVEKSGNIIHYVHNSSGTREKGVHLGTIEIINPDKTLDRQKWSDLTLKNLPYSTFFNPKNGDGTFRLKCFL